MLKNQYRDSKKAFIPSKIQYEKLYKQSIADPDSFWSEVASRISWFKGWDRVSDVDYTKAQIKWFEGGKLNACYNCVDRHIESGHGDQTALVWEGNDPSEDRSFTYNQLYKEYEKL